MFQYIIKYGDVMKYTAEDLKIISEYEKKRGIKYAKEDGKLCKWFKFLGFVAYVWMIFTSLAYILGRFITINSGMDKSGNFFVSIMVTTVVAFLSLALYFFRFKIAFFITNFVTAVITFILFAGITGVDDSITSAGSTITEYDQGYFGLKRLFYWRHGIPAVLLILFFAVAVFIIFKERKILKKEFDIIKKNKYKPQIISNDE